MGKIRAFLLLALVYQSLSFALRPSTSSLRRNSAIRSRSASTSMFSSLFSTSPAVADSSDQEEDDDKGVRSLAKRLYKTLKLSNILPYLLAFGLGIRVGALRQQQLAAASSAATGTATLAHPVRGTLKRFPIVAFLLIDVAVRDAWSLVPSWAKPSFLKRKSDDEDEDVDPNDMSSPENIAAKLGALYEASSAKLAGSSALSFIESQAAFLALLLTMAQIKDREAHHRDKLYADSGDSADPKELLIGLDEAFEFADWAYDEPEGALRKGLGNMNFKVMKHDKTNVPGIVGHYIAVAKERKLVLVGVKGTSSFEDMLTDCCGNVITYKLPGPFVEGGKTEIRCHEGILLSAERLADDIQPFIEDFVLPTDYDILVTGHSLGAGAAGLLAILLRSRIPSLLTDNGNRIRVLSYASPPVLGYEESLACAPFITTIVNNSDIIPRASFSNVLIMVEFLKYIDKKLEEKGMDVQKWQGASNFIKKLLKGKDSEMLLTADEVRTHTEDVFEKADPKHADHVYVPGRVIHMYDTWSKKDKVMNEKSKESDGTGAEGGADKVYVANGVSDVLRMIEVDPRMVSDHMSDAYRSSLKSLLA